MNTEELIIRMDSGRVSGAKYLTKRDLAAMLVMSQLASDVSSGKTKAADAAKTAWSCADALWG